MFCYFWVKMEGFLFSLDMNWLIGLCWNIVAGHKGLKCFRVNLQLHF